MKVFISWSGERSRQIAGALTSWIPVVIQYARPWMSDEDIAAGQRWHHEIATELDASNIGILCTTPENQQSPWLLFEAGALAKSFDASRVIPALFGLDIRDVKSPLSQFQSAKLDKPGTLRILQSIQNVAEEPLPAENLQTVFESMWPELEGELSRVPGAAPNEPSPRTVEAILDDLVEGNNLLAARVSELLTNPSHRPSERHHRERESWEATYLTEETLHRMELSPSDPLFLLTWASLLRDRSPALWTLAQAVAEDAYGDRRSRSADTRVRQLVEFSMLSARSKESRDRELERAFMMIYESAMSILHKREEGQRSK